MASGPLDRHVLLAAVVESSHAAIITTDLNGEITFWNPGAERLFGYSTAEVMGRPNRLLIAAERYDQETRARERVAAGQAVEPYDSAWVQKDGTRVDVSVSAFLLRADGGAVVGIANVVRDISERKHIDADRRKAERRMRGILEAMNDTFVAMDPDWRIAYANKPFEHLGGIPRTQLLGRVLWDVFPEMRQMRLYEEAHRAVAENRPSTLEEYYPPRGRWFQTRLYPTPDGLAIFGTDISERKRTEQIDHEAFAAARRLAAIVESSDDAIIGLDLAGTITEWNDAAERIFGFTVDEATGRGVRMLVPPEREGEERSMLERIRHGERVEHFETVRRRKDGSRLPVALTLSPIRDEGGAVIGASTIARDVTDQKRSAERSAFLAEAGAALAGSLDYQATLTAVANLAVPAIADWCAVDIVGEDGTLETLAVAHVDPAKIEFARTVRARYQDPASPFSPSSVVRTGNAAWAHRVTDEIIAAATHGDAQRIALVRSLGLVSYIIVPLTARGDTFGALTLATAGSGRLYNEDDVRFAGDVALRAALAVDNARAYNDAQVANRLKDEFLATLSHELRTPLNAILGYARLLQSGVLSGDKQTRALVTVERNATALTQIVEDVLDVSRIISGKIRLHIQPIDVSQVVKNAIDTVLPAADAKQIRVETTIDTRVAAVSGDPDRLQQVVWNLVSNAVKFTRPQGIVRVRVEQVGTHVEITVSDTGIGIEPAFLPHIFERFRQADSGTTREHGGIGLGLAIVRHLVELHGGTVHAVSAGLGRGATFRVTLPLTIVHAERQVERRARPRDTPAMAATSLPDLHGIQVLAVDDDADARSLLRETLESVGACVTTVGSVAGAFEALRAARPDVLLVDIGLPDVDGFEFIRRIRESTDPALREIPAAALTAYARSEDRMKSLQSGFQMHLSKPIDPRELMLAVASLTKRKGL